MNHPFFSKESAEWYTPPDIVSKVVSVLGEIDLDPASNEVANDIVGASNFYSKNGLDLNWYGNVFLNPPYLGNSSKWSDYLIDCYEKEWINEAIMLTKSAHGYKWYENLWDKCSAVCFVRERIEFLKPVDDPVASKVNKKTGQEEFFEREVAYSVNKNGENVYLVKNGPAKAGTSLFYFGRDPTAFDLVMSEIGKVWMSEQGRYSVFMSLSET